MGYCFFFYFFPPQVQPVEDEYTFDNSKLIKPKKPIKLEEEDEYSFDNSKLAKGEVVTGHEPSPDKFETPHPKNPQG